MSEKWRQFASINESENATVQQARLIQAYCGKFSPMLLSVPQAKVVPNGSAWDGDQTYTIDDFTADSGAGFPDNVPVRIVLKWPQAEILAAEAKAALENNNFDTKYPGWRDFVTAYNLSRKANFDARQATETEILADYLKYNPETEKALFGPFPVVAFPSA
jgi:hypothetical protein